MALDEEALEAMLRRQRVSDDDGQGPPPTEMTAKTDEFEVYERPQPAEAQPDPEPPAPAPEEFESPAFEEFPPPEPTPEPAAAPMQEQVPPEPEPAPEPRRPQVWPPMRSHAPQNSSAPPAATAQTPGAQPPPPQASPAAPQSPTPTPRSGHGTGCRIAIVHCRFNHEITDRMLQAAKDHAAAAGAEVVTVLTVPGVYDAPLAAQTLARRRDVDGVVVLGAVVTGDTKHDEVITFATAHKLQDIACTEEVPVGLGITGPGQSWSEAEARIGNAAHAVQAVLEQVQMLQGA